VGGRYFLQQFELAGGNQAGAFADGAIAAVEHRAGRGRTLLLGSFPGGAYFLHHAAGTRAFFAGLLGWAGVKQGVRVSDPTVQARLHTGAGGAYLWVVNPGRTPKAVTVTVEPGRGTYRSGSELWQKGTPGIQIEANQIRVTVQDRNAAVVRLTS
jgi:beta-galactosidase